MITREDAAKVAKWYRTFLAQGCAYTQETLIRHIMEYVNTPPYEAALRAYCEDNTVEDDTDVRPLFELLQEVHDKLTNRCSATDVRRRLKEFLGLEDNDA